MPVCNPIQSIRHLLAKGGVGENTVDSALLLGCNGASSLVYGPFFAFAHYRRLADRLAETSILLIQSPDAKSDCRRVAV